MIVVDVPYRTDDRESVDVPNIPGALLTAVYRISLQYPEVKNDGGNNVDFDRLFESLYNCRIEYKNGRELSRVVWDNDSDYTAFLLKWW